jgi:hypothetical protein
MQQITKNVARTRAVTHAGVDRDQEDAIAITINNRYYNTTNGYKVIQTASMSSHVKVLHFVYESGAAPEMTILLLF